MEYSLNLNLVWRNIVKVNTDQVIYFVQNVWNNYKPNLTYNDIAGAFTANPKVSRTNGRGFGWAESVHGVGNNSRQRLAWRSMSGVFTSTIALYVLRVCMVWEILYDRVLPVGAWQGRTCGQWKCMCKLWENVSEIGTHIGTYCAGT